MGRPAKYQTDAERKASKLQRERERYQSLSPEQRANIFRPKNKSNWAKRKHSNFVIPPSSSVILPPIKQEERESVESYLLRGGRVEII